MKEHRDKTKEKKIFRDFISNVVLTWHQEKWMKQLPPIPD